MRSHWNSPRNTTAAPVFLVIALLSAGDACLAQERRPGERSQVATQAADDRRVALVMGSADYRALPKLANPRSDAQDVCAMLGRLRFTVFRITGAATRRAPRDQGRQFAAKLQPGSTALFHHAGHGVQFRGGNFLLPTDMEAASTADIEERSNAPGTAADARTLLAGLAEPRHRLSVLQTQADRVEDYRRQIQRPRTEDEEKTRLLQERRKRREGGPPPRPPPVVVPGFERGRLQATTDGFVLGLGGVL